MISERSELPWATTITLLPFCSSGTIHFSKNGTTRSAVSFSDSPPGGAMS